MDLGGKIRKLRKERKITLKELSDLSGVALATLSRIETNRMTGTIRSHQAIASVLGLALPQLYADMELEQKAVDFQSQDSLSDVFIHNDKASYHMLTNKVLSKKMMPIMLKIAPGGETQTEESPGKTEKFIYILKGECKTCVGREVYALKRGQTLYFDGSLPHHFKNTGDEELSAICVITPPAL